MKRTSLPAFGALAFLIPVHGSAQQAVPSQSGWEAPVVLPASQLLPPADLAGPSFRVREQVPTDGYLAHFTIDSDFGVFTPAGVPAAQRCVREIEAIRALAAVSKGDLFAEGMKRSIEQPIDAVKNIVTDPGTTLQRAPETVGHFFHKVGSSISRGVGQIREGGGNESTPGGTAGRIGSGLLNAAGFDKARLETARQLGVDPYTDNARLNEEMDKVTWAFFAGGLPLRIGAAAASAGVALAATEMAGLPDEVYALTRSELAVRDKQMLAAMGLAADRIDSFQIHPQWSVSQQHRLALLLATFGDIPGRDTVFELALSTTSRDQSAFLLDALALLARRAQADGVGYSALRVFGRLPAALTADKSLEVPAPVDFVTWTEPVAHFAQREDVEATRKTLVHTGVLSSLAAQKLVLAGWQAVPIPYPSAK